MANKEKESSGILRYASMYAGAGAGVVVLLGRSICRACVSGVKAAGGLLVPRRKKRVECPGAVTEPVAEQESTTEASETDGDESAVALESVPVEIQTEAGSEPEQASDVETDARTAEPSDTNTGEDIPSSSEDGASTIRE